MLIYASRVLFIVFSLIALGACQQQPPKKVAPPVVVAPSPAPQAEVKIPQIIKSLLLNGEYTLAQDQLLTPVNDNAFDYFRAVLKLDPTNQRAKGGLQGIVMRYVDLARQAAAKGNYALATRMLNNARMVDPNNLLIKEVSEGLVAQIAAQPPVESYKGGDNEFLLDAKLLGRENPEIFAQLARIVEKLKATDSLAMIVARSDNEGRWIYQQMRAVDSNYLVRGDIQIGSPPRVKLVPRLESKL